MKNRSLTNLVNLKKNNIKGKKQGFLTRAECENVLSNESFEDKAEFYSKVESLNIQIFENDENSNEDDETESDSNGGKL